MGAKIIWFCDECGTPSETIYAHLEDGSISESDCWSPEGWGTLYGKTLCPLHLGLWTVRFHKEYSDAITVA